MCRGGGKYLKQIKENKKRDKELKERREKMIEEYEKKFGYKPQIYC